MNILNFSQKACFLLDETTDHVALRKLNKFLLEEIEKLSIFENKHHELSILNDSMKKAREILEKELIDYKLKFEEISKKMDEMDTSIEKGTFPSKVAPLNLFTLADRTSLYIKDEPLEVLDFKDIQQELEKEVDLKEKKPFVSFQKMSVELSSVLKQKLVARLINDENWDYLNDFNQVVPAIKRMANEIFKTFPDSLKEGKQIDWTVNKKDKLSFLHVLPENGTESILSFTKKYRNKPTLTFSLVPQVVLENLIKFPNCKSAKYHQFVLKNIKEDMHVASIKLGTKTYWLLPIVQNISEITNEFLLTSNTKSSKE